LSEKALKIQSLTVKYGSHTAVEGLGFEVNRGESLGLLGINGAGKTSTIRAVLGMLSYVGDISVFGEPVSGWKIFKRLGFAPEEALPPDYLNGNEYLKFVAGFRISDRLKRQEEVKRLLDIFELSPTKKIRDYSKGMKRKIVLAQAFLANPDFLILDEPLNGLDPIMIMKLREVIASYRAQGGTVLYCSHILAEVEKSCSHVVVLKRGKLVLNEAVSAVVQRFGSVEKAFAETAAEERDV
jgi:ABC-2 type transport system ATP-binding protein